MRVRSVRWLPSRRAKAHAISMSLTAYSLPLRKVKVISAFDPSPPLRQDCDEILSPSTGAGSSGVMASTGVACSAGVTKVARVIVGLREDVACSETTTGD